jgi:parvulin-like peptidyl-prolyl isomerase
MRVYAAVCTLTIALSVAACTEQGNKNQGHVVATIGDRAISVDQLKTEVDSLPGGKRQASRRGGYQNALDRMVDSMVAQAEAEARGLQDSDEYAESVALIDARAAREKRELIQRLLLERIEAEVSITEEELKGYYEEAKNRFLTNRLELRRIVVDTEEAAVAARERIEAGESFESVARQVSTNSRLRETGGKVEPMLRNEIPRPWRGSVFSLSEPDSVSEPFSADGEWNLFQLVSRESGVVRPLAGVKGQLEKELKRKKAVERFNNALADRREQLGVEIDKKELAGLGPMSPEGRRRVRLDEVSDTDREARVVPVDPGRKGH